MFGQELKKMGIATAYRYIEKNPKDNLRKLMTWVDRIAGEGPDSFESQRQVVWDVLNHPESNMYQLIMRIIEEVDPEVVKTIFSNFFLNAAILGWPKQEKLRAEYNCNIPWAILLDPTSACNLHCTGCWAAEYGNKLNLTFDEIDSIIEQGKELGIYFYIYTGGEPLVRKNDRSSSNAKELDLHHEYQIDYIIAPPRMAKYMEYSTKIYNIYLKYVAPEDIHAYSIDEVFVDITQYLILTGVNAYEFAGQMIKDVLKTTGITATAGIGTNLYLAKIAMDIEAKHIKADSDGVRIAMLTEKSYRQKLWDHRPLTDFWRIGPQTAKKLEQNGMFTMGDVARCSVGKINQFHNEELLYRLFGINAELIIDHAWGWEPCTIAHIKAYRPQSSSIENGQVLHCPYTAEKTRLIVKEMTDQLLLQLVDKGLVTDQMVLTIGYDIENLTDPKLREQYHGDIVTDRYGRKIPKSAHGSVNIGRFTSSAKLATETVLKLYDTIIDQNLLVRRLSLTANHVVPEGSEPTRKKPQQLDLFTDYEVLEKKEQEEKAALDKEKKMQQAMLQIKKKFGKNAILKGMNLLDGATAKERNEQIGGHKA